ncbi:MAG: poly(R)-hydroxyalkanoic acid synthase subunit PhaE [Pseudomonadota bacterium]
MAGDGAADDTLFRLWRDGARAFAALAEGFDGGGDGGSEPGAGPGAKAARGAWVQAGATFEAWSRFLEALAAAHEARAAGPGASPFDPAGWMRGAGEGGMADLWRWFEGPEFADIFGEERRLIREGREWLRFAAALEQFRMIVAEGWLRAFRRFAESLAADDGAPEPPGPLAEATGSTAEARDAAAWDRLVAHWRRAADAEMARLQTSETYLAAQRDLLDAGLALRARLRARAERMAAFLGLPTRAELDDVHAELHALRREMRAMKRGRPDAGGGP